MIQSIIKPIRNFVDSMVNLGSEQGWGSLDSFYVKLLNIVALAIIMVLVAAFSKTGVDDDLIFYVPIVGMLFSAIGALYLNSIREFELAKVTLIVIIPIIQFINLLYVDVESVGIETTFLVLALLAAIVYRNRWVRFILAIVLMLFFALVFVSRDYGVGNYFYYTPLVLFTGVLVGVNVIVEYLQDTARVLNDRNDQLTHQNQSLEDLVAQNDLKTELLGILSHDLKGPAAAFNQISKKVSFLLQKERYEELVEFGNYFEMAGDKIYHDIDRLLNWTVAQKKDIVIRIEEMFPNRLIGRIVEGLQYQVRDKEVNFNNSIDGDISFNTDRHILEIILKNLLINAANHSDDRERVNITYTEESNYHVIGIHNTGAAINMSIVDQAKMGRYRKSKEGHGLGLGICFSLIKFLNGEIEFLSDTQVGTTVLVKIPI